MRRHGPRFFRRVWGELRTLEWLGAARRDPEGWELTERGMYWLLLLMSAFFESVNDYRDAMRAHLRDELPEDEGPRDGQKFDEQDTRIFSQSPRSHAGRPYWLGLAPT